MVQIGNDLPRRVVVVSPAVPNDVPCRIVLGYKRPLSFTDIGFHNFMVCVMAVWHRPFGYFADGGAEGKQLAFYCAYCVSSRLIEPRRAVTDFSSIPIAVVAGFGIRVDKVAQLDLETVVAHGRKCVPGGQIGPDDAT